MPPPRKERVRFATVLTAALTIVLTGCKMPGEKQDFGKIVDEFVYGSLALSPVSATAAGYHEHNGKKLDEMLDDFSPSGIGEQRRFYHSFHDRMEVIKPETLDPEERADYQMIENQIQLSLLEINLIRSYTHNPTIYVELVQRAVQPVRARLCAQAGPIPGDHQTPRTHTGVDARGSR